MTLKDFTRWAESYGRAYWIDAPVLAQVINPATGGRLDLLYRQANFQIERVIHGPNETIPIHRHPSVDSYEFPLWGSGEIWLNKRRFAVDDSMPWRSLYVSRKTWHGGFSKERGGAFLSVQGWDEPPTGSVIDSWERR